MAFSLPLPAPAPAHVPVPAHACARTLRCFKRPPNQKSALRIVRYDILTHMQICHCGLRKKGAGKKAEKTAHIGAPFSMHHKAIGSF